jgi:hypothetical protein
MPVFRIHRMKEAPRQQFRWAPHVSAAANAKLKDYEPSGEMEAESEYAAWASLRQSDRPLEIGDILEILSSDATATGVLRICKYVGFEEARWFVPEPQPVPAGSAPLPAPQTA